MYNDVFKRIINSSQTKSLTFFVGAGVSALSNAPKWSELINKICNEINMPIQEHYSADQYLQIPQIYYCSINKDDEKYYSFIEECLNNTMLQPNEIHKKIFELNPASIVTTNFDDLLEKSALQSCKGYKVIACDQEIPSINGSKFILKLHGDLRHKNIVFKEEDYLNYSNNFKLTETMLKSIFATNTVVFIGYGLNDYNIKLVLNWAKRLLKDNFNKPIFIYTDDKELTPSELQYQEERGLTVIEYQKLLSNKSEQIEFIERYKCVIDEIINSSQMSVNGKDKYELFAVLYELVLPLNKFNTLRTQDLQQKLSPNIIVQENGVIFAHPNGKDILSYYLEVNDMTLDERAGLEKDIIEKYTTITSVFLKARITTVKVEQVYKKINGLKSYFADLYCISFDFISMNKYTNKNKKDIKSRFRQAYYLAKLNKHKEAFEIFSNIAVDSYNSGDYINYYLSEVNKNNLFSVLKSLNNSLFYLGSFDTNGIKKNEKAFEELPVEFQAEYSSFKDLNSVNLLYKNSYDSFIEGKKLQNSIESNSMEMGLTSSEIVICRINNNLHFLLGNGIYIDQFSEFKNTINYLMSLLVYKYSTQEKIKLQPNIFGDFDNDKIIFDAIDFYCFVEYFDSENLTKLLNKHSIEILEFANKQEIEQSIRNILKYYDYLIKINAPRIEVLPFQGRLKTCFCLLKHIDLSQPMVDELCCFIFKYEFKDIRINDKIMLLDSLLYKQKKYSGVTQKIISDKLFSYIDQHIIAEKKGESFEVYSSSTGINYPSLIYYIDPDNINIVSRKLSLRVSKIVNNDYSKMYKSIYKHYFYYLSKKQKKKVIRWTKEKLKSNFTFDLFRLLINADVKIGSEQIIQLKEFLKSKDYSGESVAGIKTYPDEDEFEDLKNVGYWIHLKLLPKKEFAEFVGLNDNFDFYYQYEGFDFNKFDISWLYNLHPKTYESISKDDDVRQKIRLKIAEALLPKTLKEDEQKVLYNILIKYFMT